MDFKVGDKVRIRGAEELLAMYGRTSYGSLDLPLQINRAMEAFCGNVTTVQEVRASGNYMLKNIMFIWCAEALELLERGTMNKACLVPGSTILVTRSAGIYLWTMGAAVSVYGTGVIEDLGSDLTCPTTNAKDIMSVYALVNALEYMRFLDAVGNNSVSALLARKCPTWVRDEASAEKTAMLAHIAKLKAELDKATDTVAKMK